MFLKLFCSRLKGRKSHQISFQSIHTKPESGKTILILTACNILWYFLVSLFYPIPSYSIFRVLSRVQRLKRTHWPVCGSLSWLRHWTWKCELEAPPGGWVGGWVSLSCSLRAATVMQSCFGSSRSFFLCWRFPMSFSDPKLKCHWWPQCAGRCPTPPSPPWPAPAHSTEPEESCQEGVLQSVVRIDRITAHSPVAGVLHTFIPNAFPSLMPLFCCHGESPQ